MATILHRIFYINVDTISMEETPTYIETTRKQLLKSTDTQQSLKDKIEDYDCFIENFFIPVKEIPSRVEFHITEIQPKKQNIDKLCFDVGTDNSTEALKKLNNFKNTMSITGGVSNEFYPISSGVCDTVDRNLDPKTNYNLNSGGWVSPTETYIRGTSVYGTPPPPFDMMNGFTVEEKVSSRWETLARGNTKRAPMR